MPDSTEGRSVASPLWRRVWIAVKIGRHVYGWWPGDWSRRQKQPWTDAWNLGVMIGASDE